MRFLLDEDLSHKVAEIGRGLGLNVVSVHEVDRRGFNDREQLVFAAADERALMTRNRDDFIRLTIEFFQTQQPHHGVIIVPRSLPNDAAARIAHALKRWNDDRAPTGLGGHFIDFLAV